MQGHGCPGEGACLPTSRRPGRHSVGRLHALHPHPPHPPRHRDLYRQWCIWGCSSLRELTLSAALTTIGTSAFTHCISLTELTLPATVTTIRARAFSGCNNLRKLTLSTDLATIGDQAFNNCYSLTEFALPAAGFSREPTCSHSAFHGCAPSLSQRSTGRRVRLVCASCKNPCEVFTSGLKEFPTRVQCPNCKMSEHEMYERSFHYART